MARAQQSVHVSEGSQWRVPCWLVSTPAHSSHGLQAYFDSRGGIVSPVKEVRGSKLGITSVPFLVFHLLRMLCWSVFDLHFQACPQCATGGFSYDYAQSVSVLFFSRRSYWTRWSQFSVVNLTFLWITIKNAECIHARSKGKDILLVDYLFQGQTSMCMLEINSSVYICMKERKKGKRAGDEPCGFHNTNTQLLYMLGPPLVHPWLFHPHLAPSLFS